MSRVHEVARRYNAAESIIQQGASIFAVGDPVGAQLNGVIRRALFELGEERSEAWNNVLHLANVLRWRRMTQPQPAQFQTQQALIDHIEQQAKRLQNLVNDGPLLEAIANAAIAVGETDSPLGKVLLQSIQEVGPEACIVVASNVAARTGLTSWLDEIGATVVVSSELGKLGKVAESSYVVAPPAFMPPSVITAPFTPEVTFLVPTWFRNQSVPASTLGPHAEGKIVVRTRVYEVGDTTEPESASIEDQEVADTFFPEPVWGMRTSGDREPASDEVEARKILLAGELGLWLDDGDRIRSLDPRQPEGARVGYEAVSRVIPGTYLVLREGETERGAMYNQAISNLGMRAADITETQVSWKRRLEERLERVGPRQAAEQLQQLGVRSSGQVRAWTEPRLICPQSTSDFSLLLNWLNVPTQPTYRNAISLRRALYTASADHRRELEKAIARADLAELECRGVLRLNLQEEFRGVVVARVLAKAPYTEIVSRRQVRLPYTDRSAQWLD